MDWDRDGDWDKPPDERRSYYTMSNENNYTIWAFLKKCFDRGLVYRGYDAMPWCPRCGVGLSQMEMHEGYQRVAHRAVFVRFPLRGRTGESLLLWTTTPWTLTSNVGAAVNPNLTYVKVKHRDEIYYLAKGALTARRLEEEFKRKEWIEGVPKLKTLEQIFKEKGGFEVVGELSGKDLLGWRYDGPFDEVPGQKHAAGYPPEIAEVVLQRNWAPAAAAKQVHRVIAWDEVGETEGTGIVHIAPGCGKEDFELGQKEGLPPVAPLDESGNFLPGFGPLAGKSAIDKDTTDWILENLQQKGLLLAVERYPHSYPHCWRCKTELLFRLVDEWFINMSWREEIMKICHDIHWIPEFGLQRELDWLKNMGDWMISKKRFWGLALPIWVCEKCNGFEVIGGKAELRQKAVAGWKEFAGHSPHRPWVDLVKTKCPNCGGRASRIPDVGNPWLDAGIVPYSTVGYNRDREYWEKWFPADFITESFPGQFRNWFYAMLAMSTMMTGRAPFKDLLGYALVMDERARPMSKTQGNAIRFEEAAEQISADLARWMFCRQNVANNINFGYGPAEEVRSKFTLKLWNSYAFFCNYARLDKFDPQATQVPLPERPDIDRWILSDLQLLIETARHAYERYDVQALCLAAERFVDDKLSNWYVRRNRRRFWKSEQSSDKLAAYQTLYTVLTTVTKLIAPVMPFLTEEMYHNLVLQGARADGSVHLADFPGVDSSLVDKDLSADMDALLRLVSLGSAARNSVKIKVRQPLSEMKVQPGDDRERRAVERFADQICEELNVKHVTLHDAGKGSLLSLDVKLNMKTAGPKFGPRLKEVQIALAGAHPAEVAKMIQAGEAFQLTCTNGLVLLEPEDVVIQQRAPEGWAGVAERGTQVLVDARISEELKQEGMARDVVRHVQDLRKKAGLEMDDRIVLHLATDSPPLRQAIQTHLSYICNETLAQWSPKPLEGPDVHQTVVKIDGHALTVQLRKVAKG
jgi:isoleucyl-tRNA synthetase